MVWKEGAGGDWCRIRGCKVYTLLGKTVSKGTKFCRGDSRGILCPGKGVHCSSVSRKGESQRGDLGMDDLAFLSVKEQGVWRLGKEGMRIQAPESRKI